MKAIKFLTIILALTAGTAAWGQLKAVDGYAESLAIATKEVPMWEPSQEAVDSTCYLLGVNYGVFLERNGFFDRFTEIRLIKLLTGLNDAIETGNVSNPYALDQEWAGKFEYSPYEMNGTLSSYIKNRASGKTISSATMDSVCYHLGVNYGLMIADNGFFKKTDEMNFMEFLTGIDHALKNGAPESDEEADLEWAAQFKISPYEINEYLNGFLDRQTEYIKALNSTIEKYFLMINASNDGVMETESGLQYIIHNEGEGDKPTDSSTVTVNYIGYLLDGTVFDEGEDISFMLENIILGWQEGIGLIGKGGEITLFIPSILAYGPFGIEGAIEPNTLLVFKIKLLDFTDESSESDVEQE